MDRLVEHLLDLLLPLIISLVAVFSTALAHAEANDEIGNDEGYDAIVNQLNKETSQNTAKMKAQNSAESDPLETVMMHGGIGFATMVETISLDHGRDFTMSNRGIQAAFGIDLFSENWMAEGTARSFGETEDSTAQASLKEFELKVYYKERFSPQMGFRAGPGLAARYLTVREPGEPQRDYTTPASVFTLGLDFYLNQKFSLGVDVTGRTAMINDTVDHNALDATLRMDAHF